MEELLKRILGKLDAIEREAEARNRDMLNVEEAAKVLNISTATVYALCSKRKLPHYKPGKQIFFDREELKAWMKRNRVEAEERAEATAVLNDYINR